MSNRPESFSPCPLARLLGPVAFAPRQSSSLSREPPAGRAAYSSEHAFAQKVQPNTGLHPRTKAEPYDQIAGDYCDLFSRWVKEWQSHRGARWKCGSQKLDVAPSRLAISSSPDQRDNGGGENSHSIPTMTHTIRQVDTHPVSDFSQAIADSDVSSATTRPDPSACDLSEVVQSVGQNAELRAHRLV